MLRSLVRFQLAPLVFPNQEPWVAGVAELFPDSPNSHPNNRDGADRGSHDGRSRRDVALVLL